MSPSAQQTLRVLIASDRPIVRAGLAAVLRPFRSQVTVVGEVDGAGAALAESARSEPHVVLFDAALGGADGLEQVEQLVRASGSCRIVVVARRDEARFIWLTLQRGASGFVLETVTGADLVDALDEVAGGGTAVDPTLAGGRGIDGDEAVPLWPGAHLGLTERESQVLELLADGELAGGVSSRLGMSRAEVKTHVRSAYRRLHARDRSDALARLAREGLYS
ncbi:MAG TPA: response regulator transcription factor [Acidimicrobiales bacterium]|nr:response regulator transcription factor [Acidimicrobiales bacterium]